MASNVLAPEVSKVWRPPYRSGRDWHHWLQFDFLDVVRLNRVQITLDGNSRVMEEITVQSSNTPYAFSTVAKGLNTINFPQAVMARYMRIVLSKPSDTTGEDTYIIVQK